MSISFNGIPTTLRVPFVYAEFDSSNAQQGLDVLPYKVLLIGQKTSSGSKAAVGSGTGQAWRITSAAQAAQYFGAGSQLHLMALAYFANNQVTEVHAIAVAEPSGGAAASGTIAVSGTASAAGTLAVYIGGQLVSVGVASSATATQVATNLAAAINALTSLPVTATSSTGTVTITAKNQGLVANSLNVQLNFAEGDATPAGLTVTVTGPSSGSGNVDLTNVWAAIEDEQFHIMAMPYIDATSLTSAETELESRWGPLRQQEGIMFVASPGDLSTVTTLGLSRNSKQVSLMTSYGSPTTQHEWAASVAGVVAQYGNIDPARPFQTLTLAHVKTPPKTMRFTPTERDIMLHDGVSTHVVAAGGVVQIERLITTYQVNGFGAPDIAYLDVNTPLTLGYLRASFRNNMLRKFPRSKLADDGTQYGPGQAIVTPKVIKAECIAVFRQWEDAGLVEGIDQFVRDLIVERNASDPNRVDILLPPNLVNQLRVTAVKIGFLL